MLFLQAALGFLEPIRARPWDRPGLLGTALVQPALGLTQPPTPALRRPKLRRQLVAARFTEALVLLGVDRVGLGENLARDLLVIARRLHRGVGATFVPSTAITPTRTSPDSAQSARTSPNSSASAVSWR